MNNGLGELGVITGIQKITKETALYIYAVSEEKIILIDERNYISLAGASIDIYDHLHEFGIYESGIAELHEWLEKRNMKRYFFTFGTSPKYPFSGGWVEIIALTRKDAVAIYRLHYPDLNEGIINCCDVYFEQELIDNKMMDIGNLGYKCHRVYSYPYELELNMIADQISREGDLESSLRNRAFVQVEVSYASKGKNSKEAMKCYSNNVTVLDVRVSKSHSEVVVYNTQARSDLKEVSKKTLLRMECINNYLFEHLITQGKMYEVEISTLPDGRTEYHIIDNTGSSLKIDIRKFSYYQNRKSS